MLRLSVSSSIRVSFVLPERFAQLLRERREHHVEADADSFFLAHVGIYGMLQKGGKHQQRSVAHPDHHLVGVVRRQLHDRGPDDAGLSSRVVKVERIGARPGAHVVDTAQEVIGVAVSCVQRPWPERWPSRP